MLRAAGVLHVTPDNRVLLMRRMGKDHAGMWAFPGGEAEGAETAEQTARRETQEETGREPGKLVPWTRRVAEDVDFVTFLAEVAEEFAPVLNGEHSAYCWMDRVEALTSLPLHPGVSVALLRFDMDELGVAKAMRAGELASPQRYGNMLLVDLRITGTGAAYRKALNEYVWRDPSLYLNEHFVERCNGLQVVLEHPKRGKALDSQEFHDRSIGSVFVPYIKGDEVWAIAKIYDDAAIEMFCTERISTSPMVVLRDADGGLAGTRYELQDGSILLVEGKPSLLDHIAVVELGVWDKGGPPVGVSTNSSSGVTAMAEKSEVGMADVMKRLDAVCSRMDAWEEKEKTKADAARSDAEKEEEKKRADKARADEEKEEEKKRADKARADAEKEEEKKRADAARSDAEKEEEKKRADAAKKKADAEKEEEKERADKARADAEAKAKKEAAAVSDSALTKRISDLESRIPVELPDADRQLFVNAQMKNERVAQAFGDSAPRWLNGDSLTLYRRRLIDRYKAHSRAWKDVDLAPFADKALDVVEDQVYADAYLAAAHPTDVPVGTLRQIQSRDQTGRTITRFVGSDDAAAWTPFTFGERKGRINTQFGRHG